MAHTAAFQVLSFSSAVGTWRPRSLSISHRQSPSSSVRLLHLDDKIESTSEDLSPKELHHLRKKKERKVLRKVKKELLEKKRLAELAKLPVVTPNYGKLRFENNRTLEDWNKPRKPKKGVAVSVLPQPEAGVETPNTGEENRRQKPSRFDRSWSEFESVYRELLKTSIGGNDMSSSQGGIIRGGSGHYESFDADHSETYVGISRTSNPSESDSLLNSDNLEPADLMQNVCETKKSRTGGQLLEQTDSTKFLQDQDGNPMESISHTTHSSEKVERPYRKKVTKVIVGERNSSPVYLSTEDDDGRDKRNIRRDDLDEQKQLEWLANRLNSVNVRTDGVHFSRLVRSGGLKITDGRAIILLQLLGARGNWRRAMQLVDWLSSRHQYPPLKSRFVYTTLLAVLGRSRRPIEAFNVFKVMCEDTTTYPDMAAYHSIAVTLGQAGFLAELLDLISILRQEPKNAKYNLKLEHHGVLEPDIVILNAVLNACVPHKDWKCALWVLDELRKQKLQPVSASYGLAIEVMVKADKLNLAFQTLEMMERDYCHPNGLTYKVLVEGLGRAGKPDKAIALVKRMEQRGIVPTSGVYFALASTLCRSGRLKEATLQIGRLIKISDKPLVETYTGLIAACERGGQWQDAIALFKSMQEVCAPNIGTYNIMISMYGRHKLFSEAKYLFDRLKIGRLSPKMLYKNDCRLTPDKFTYEAMLGTCAVCGEWEIFQSTYKQMLIQGYELNSKRHTWILAALGKAGKHDLVESLFARILARNEDVTSELYQIMICSCVTVGRDEEAFSYLEEMVKQAKSISRKQLEKFHEAACSLPETDRRKFLGALDLLQISSDFIFQSCDKFVTSNDQILSNSRSTYRELRASMVTYEERGRTTYRREALSIEENSGTDSLATTMARSSGHSEVREKKSSEHGQSLIVAEKKGKRRKPTKPVYRLDPEIPGWELLWTSEDQEHRNQLDSSLFQ